MESEQNNNVFYDKRDEKLHPLISDTYFFEMFKKKK
jgi:hypothetical protein